VLNAKLENKQEVIVLDFGSQYTQLIARRLRELNVYSKIVPCTTPYKFNANTVAVILSGGPSSVLEDDAPEFDVKWLESNLPVLAICYGLQLVVQLLGGKLSQGTSREYGPANIKIFEEDLIFKGIPIDTPLSVWMSHGDHVTKIPDGYRVLASSDGAPFAAIASNDNMITGLQFHPEVLHTNHGMQILRNFICRITQITPSWTSTNMMHECLDYINKNVPESGNVICGLSGGVDSTVAAALVHKVIGERLHCIFVDNGLLRKGESDKVIATLGTEGLGLKIHRIDASERFVNELKGITDPEQKRKIIGRIFIEVFEEESHKISNVTHLVQGTLYPDVIESVSHTGPSAKIKTHHNVGGLPEKMKLKLIEPLRDLFKDEVRKMGFEMGLPHSSLMRQPFPGPGLAVRILGGVNPYHLEILRNADDIFLSEIKSAGLYHQLWQSFCVLLPIKSVGVMGDGRTYEEVIALRAVTSEDGMTANWAYLPEELLRKVSSRIINEIKGINRVVQDISSKPPATIEWE
jgi:GMP synthase (glutamine-hydrolysing)